MASVGLGTTANWTRPIMNSLTKLLGLRLQLPSVRLLFAGGVMAICSGCVAYGYGPHPHHGYDVPAGHLPPPGECRIWYPDRPAGHQPPPGICQDLEWQVPPGAALIRG